jgi:hypothetical protein
MRRIAFVNESTLIGPDDLAACVAALQTQVSRDFAATWGIDARLHATDRPADDDEVLSLFDDAGQAEARGGHRTGGPRPRGFVFVRPCLDAGEPWQAAVSGELLALLADPLLCLTAIGPSPGGGLAVFAVEACDPVADDGYEVNGVPVANFVLPTWFHAGPLPDEALVDYLGRLSEPFTVGPAGVASYCTELGRWQAWFGRRCPKHRRQVTAFDRRRRRIVGR